MANQSRPPEGSPESRRSVSARGEPVDGKLAGAGRPLGPGGWRTQLGRFAVTLVLSAGVVTAVGLMRLTRQFPSAGESPSLLVPFLLPVVALALEAGSLVALSAAQASTLSRLVEPEPRPLVRARSTLLSVLVALAVLVGAQLVPRGTEHPGAFANDLIQSASASCGASGDVAVPLLGLRVRCEEPRRLEGPMPGVRGVDVSMSMLTFSDDLRSVDIRDFSLDAKRALSVHLHAGHATIAGIAPWSRSTRSTPSQRLGVLALLAMALWSSGLVVRAVAPVAPVEASGALAPAAARAPSRRLRWLSSLVVAVPGAAVAATFIAIEQGQSTPWAFSLAALLGAVAMGLLRLLVRRRPQMFGSSGGF